MCVCVCARARTCACVCHCVFVHACVQLLLCMSKERYAIALLLCQRGERTRKVKYNQREFRSLKPRHTTAFPSDFLPDLCLPEIFPSCESSFRLSYGHFFRGWQIFRQVRHIEPVSTVSAELVVLPYTNFMSRSVQPITGDLAINPCRATRHIMFFLRFPGCSTWKSERRTWCPVDFCWPCERYFCHTLYTVSRKEICRTQVSQDVWQKAVVWTRL